MPRVSHASTLEKVLEQAVAMIAQGRGHELMRADIHICLQLQCAPTKLIDFYGGEPSHPDPSNVAGANIINIALILGTTATVHPRVVHRTIITPEIPMLRLATSAAMALSLDMLLDGTPNALARGDGLVLCLLFGVSMYYTAVSLKLR